MIFLTFLSARIVILALIVALLKMRENCLSIILFILKLLLLNNWTIIFWTVKGKIIWIVILCVLVIFIHWKGIAQIVPNFCNLKVFNLKISVKQSASSNFYRCSTIFSTLNIFSISRSFHFGFLCIIPM